MNRQLNFRFLAIVLILLFLAGGALYFFHSRQQETIAVALLQQANQAVTEKDTARAIKFFERYLAMRPSDAPALTRYATLLFDQAKTGEEKVKALTTLDKAVIKDSDNDDLRRKLVELAIQPGMDEISRPDPHLKRLLERQPNDIRLIDLLATRYFNDGKHADAIAEFDRILKIDPKRTEIHFRKAAIQRVNLNAIKPAEQTITEMLKANDTAQAHLLAALFWRQYGTAEQVNQAVDRASKLEPNHAEVLIAQSELALGRNQLDEARQLLQKCHQLHPTQIVALQGLAAIELEAGRPAEATAALQKALEIDKTREDLYFSLAEAYLRAEKFKEAETLIQTLRSKEYRPVLIQLLEAQVLASKGDWVKATRLLEEALPQVSDFGPLVKQCYLVLARCYEAIGDLDNRLAAYRRVVADDPLNQQAMLQLARSLAEQNRGDEALTLLVERQLYQSNYAALVLLAELILDKQLALPANQRNWTEFDNAYTSIFNQKKDSAQVALLHIRRLGGEDKTLEAQAALRKAREAWPKDIALIIAQAEGHLSRGETEAFRKTLADARTAMGDQPKFRILEARALLQPGKPADTKALDALTADLKPFTLPQQLELLRLMLNVRLGAGDLPGAIRLGGELDKLLPSDLSLQLIRFDLANKAEDEPGMSAIIEKIKSLEGPTGVYTPLAQALLIMWKNSAKSDKKQLDQAGIYLAAVAKKRSDWPRLQLAEGKLRQLQGDNLNTLTNYQQAVSRGSRDPEALAWLVNHYYQQQRFKDASDVMKLLPEQRITGGLMRIAAELNLASKDFKQALYWAGKSVPSESRSAADLLWKGKVYSSAGERQQAEAFLRQSISLTEGKEGAVWLALVQHLVRNRDSTAAAQATEEAKTKLTEQTIWHPLCLEAIGKFDEAGPLFQQLAAAKPQDLNTLRAAADYFVRRNDGKQAEPLLQKLLDLQTPAAADKAWAKRTLAIILASRGDYFQSRKAFTLLGLLDGNDKIITRMSANEPVEELRARAFVFGLNRSRSLRIEATNIFEQLNIRQARTNDDLFFQARLHNDLGDWSKARECMQILLTREPDNVNYLEYMIRNLLSRGDISSIKLYVERLEKAQPSSDLTIDLKARLLLVQQESKAAYSLIENHFLKSQPPRPEWAAELLEDMKLFEPAESIYRQLAKDVAKPATRLSLAKFLGRQRKLAEALALCKAARSTATPEEVAFISIEALYHSPQRTKEQLDEVALWVEALMTAQPTVLRMKLLAALRNLQGRYEESLKLYEKVVTADKNDAGSRNNLAFLLSLHQKQHAEANQLLNEGLMLLGPHPDLLDTKALVSLQMNKPEQAREDLLQAMDLEPSAMAQFHLACVHKALRNRQQAVNAWEEMKRLKLNRDEVHPLEWPVFDALAQEFDGGIPAAR